MAQFFKASELVEFAIQIEKNGELFYRTADGKLKNKKVAEMFAFFADEEVKHRKLYEGMLKSVEKYEPAEMFSEEYFQYLRAYADEHIFVKKQDIEKKALGAKSDIDAIELALGFEKDSILFYLEMRNMVPGSDRSVIDKIIDEERRHYSKLIGIKDLIKK